MPASFQGDIRIEAEARSSATPKEEFLWIWALIAMPRFPSLPQRNFAEREFLFSACRQIGSG
jgi:hypothetical protein